MGQRSSSTHSGRLDLNFSATHTDGAERFPDKYSQPPRTGNEKVQEINESEQQVDGLASRLRTCQSGFIVTLAATASRIAYNLEIILM